MQVPRFGFPALDHPNTPKAGVPGTPISAREPSLTRDDGVISNPRGEDPDNGRIEEQKNRRTESKSPTLAEPGRGTRSRLEQSYWFTGILMIFFWMA